MKVLPFIIHLLLVHAETEFRCNACPMCLNSKLNHVEYTEQGLHGSRPSMEREIFISEKTQDKTEKAQLKSAFNTTSRCRRTALPLPLTNPCKHPSDFIFCSKRKIKTASFLFLLVSFISRKRIDKTDLGL